MKANELRIGCNFQLENGVLGGGTATIKNKYDLDVAFDLLESNLIKPIPLTEEWLLKFGFLKDLENNIYLNINAYAFLCWQNNRVELLDNDNNFRISHCNYVHQLQNLYFALTGEELTFKSE